MASAAFAMVGFWVTAVEPDLSNTVGCGAIKQLKEEFKLQNISIINSVGENIPLPGESFDIVYVRQALHHAGNLKQMLRGNIQITKK